ncbi:MAG TPA: MFS transporter [Gemmataceae bacterium]|jgi:MFS family permease
MRLRTYFAGLTPTTFLLALASLFSDVASEMIYPILPVFLTETLGASKAVVGLVGGVTEAVQQVVQGLSGWVSDRLGRRKPVAFVGFAVSAAAKPLIGLAAAWPGVLAARCLDRLGSGVKSAPRDALVAASADAAHRGKAFGLEGAGDNLGAFLGPLVALALLPLFRADPSSIFLIAFAPGVVASLLIALVRERPVAAAAKAKLDVHVGRFPRAYWAYLGAAALFGVGNSSNMFLILRATDAATPLETTIVVYALYNLVAALASYPAGYLSDHLGRKAVLLIAFLVFAVVYAGFGATANRVVLGGLFVLYGLYQGIFRSVGKALAADLVPAEVRASGVGWFSATVGVTGLIASLVGGLLWDRVGPPATFFYGAASAVVGSVALAVAVPGRVSRP